MNPAELTEQIFSIAKETGSFLREQINLLRLEEIEVKSLNNFVTHVDKNAEKMLVDRLSALIPGSGFIVEGNTVDFQANDYIWIVDPLDGTTNFIHGVPLYCVSIGLMHKNELLSGVIYEVNLDECFYAWKGGGAWLNDKQINVTSASCLKDALLATGFPYHDYNLLDNYMALFRYCLQNTHGLRRLGSAAADLAYVACGRYDGFFEYGLSSWDVAAGMLIVSEAGGITGDFRGGQDALFGKEIIAANHAVYNELLTVVKTFFPS